MSMQLGHQKFSSIIMLAGSCFIFHEYIKMCRNCNLNLITFNVSYIYAYQSRFTMEQFKHNYQATHINQNKNGEFVRGVFKAWARRRQSQT